MVSILPRAAPTNHSYILDEEEDMILVFHRSHRNILMHVFRLVNRMEAAWYSGRTLDVVRECPGGTALSSGIKFYIIFIGICGQITQDKLASNMKATECFSIIADETLDVSGQDQL